jgi:hypothetical protein
MGRDGTGGGRGKDEDGDDEEGQRPSARDRADAKVSGALEMAGLLVVALETGGAGNTTRYHTHVGQGPDVDDRDSECHDHICHPRNVAPFFIRFASISDCILHCAYLAVITPLSIQMEGPPLQDSAAAGSAASTSASSLSPSTSSPKKRARYAEAGGAVDYAPYLAMYNEEQGHRTRLEHNAAAVAKSVFDRKERAKSWGSTSSSSSSSSSSSTFAIPPEQIPRSVYAPSPNYLASAFVWGVAYTNALRELEAGAGAVSASPTSDAASASASPVLARARLRSASPLDVGTIMGFIRDLAAFEREPDAVITDEATLLRDGFTSGRQFHAILAEVPAEVAEQARREHEQSMGKATASSGEGAKGGADAAAKRVRVEGAEPGAAAHPAPSSSSSASSSSAWVPVGFAVCHASYSTWEGRCIYVEDLYIPPEFRRKGLSGLFFAAISRAAHVSRCRRMQWTALDWNEPAIAGYTGPKIGAARLDDWSLFRLSVDGIRRLSGVPLRTGTTAGREEEAEEEGKKAEQERRENGEGARAVGAGAGAGAGDGMEVEEAGAGMRD